jgi:hypothetical protein
MSREKSVVFVGVGLVLAVVACEPGWHGSSPQPAQVDFDAIWQRQADETDKSHQRAEELDRRYSLLLEKWERQTQRYDVLLDRWEAQAQKSDQLLARLKSSEEH